MNTDPCNKKHISQMTKDEVRFLKSLVRGNYALSKHGRTMMAERRIKEDEIKHTISECNIVEYHICEEGANSRITLRGNVAIRDYITCVVLDITQDRIVTAYKNYHLNHHNTSDLDAYNKNIDIVADVKKSLNVVNKQRMQSI